MIITSKLKMDLIRPTATAVIHAVQDDRYSRNVELSLFSNGTAWPIPENVSVQIRYSKPDGTGGEYDAMPDGQAAWQCSGNTLTIQLAPQVLTVPGAVTLAATLVQDQRQISTFTIILCVDPAVNTAIRESEDYYPMYRTAEEPAEEDIPKVFFGGALPQTKDNVIMPFRYVSKTRDIRGYCKTKAQGSSSMSYPKKNQTVRLYKDADCTKELNVAFKHWGPQNKFCFKANWIDLTHARNVVTARLWGDVVKSRSNYAELPELLRTSPNQGAIDGFPVKVYADGVYQGRYTLNIPKAAWMANMDEDLNKHCILCGESNANDSTLFRAGAKIDGSDWSDEVHDTVPTVIKAQWNEAIHFIVNSTDAVFVSDIGNYFDVDALIDYYLFGLATCGLDAFGKNQLFMTWNGMKWFATMYDLDSTWGLWWDGTTFVSSSYSRTEYQDFKDGNGNLLYIRLESLFADAIKARWEELKTGALSISNILSHFERFMDIASPELVKEDYASTTGNGAFTGIPSQSTNNIQQIRAYAAERLLWTEQYLNGEAEEESDILYELPQATVFDGSSVYIDTGVQLFDTAKDFTVFVDLDGAAPASGAYGYLFDTSVVENLDNSNLSFGYEIGDAYPRLRASGKSNHAWEDVDDSQWGHRWDNLQRVVLVYTGGVFSFGKYLKKNDTTVKYIHAADGVIYTHSNDTLKIGAKKSFWADNMTDYWTGTVNACRVYNRAVTEEEAAALLTESL